jgi:UDPglucose 6-dehydrogenase
MHITVVGTGYVGLVSAACFADLGHTVVGVDIDEAKVQKLQTGTPTIYEPGLEDILKRGLESGRLSFTTDIKEALPHTKIVFSAVATPPNEDYSADLRAVFTVAETVARHADHDLVFVNKSTVPVGTGEDCEKEIRSLLNERNMHIHIPVVSNPEFLREGTAVKDTMSPDRIVVGINGNNWARETMEEFFQPLVRTGKPLVFMGRESAETVKYASNAFLANKISFANMLSAFCEATGGNIRDVTKGMGLDNRIGPRFLQAGIGYGGSCFPKDVKALIAMSRHYDTPLPLVEATHEINQRQRMRFFQRILNTLPQQSQIAVWGLAFKPKTDDMREAPSLDCIPLLTAAGHTVTAYDPVAMDNAKQLLPKEVQYAQNPMEAATGADALIILTEWDVFRGIDFTQLTNAMNGIHIFDGRNIYEPEEVQEAGLAYHGIGLGNSESSAVQKKQVRTLSSSQHTTS